MLPLTPASPPPVSNFLFQTAALRRSENWLSELKQFRLGLMISSIAVTFRKSIYNNRLINLVLLEFRTSSANLLVS